MHITQKHKTNAQARCPGKHPPGRETSRDTRRPPETDRERFRATIHRLNCLRSLVVDRRALGGRTILHASCYYLGSCAVDVVYAEVRSKSRDIIMAERVAYIGITSCPAWRLRLCSVTMRPRPIQRGWYLTNPVVSEKLINCL